MPKKPKKPPRNIKASEERVVTIRDMENMARSIYDHADKKAGIKTDRPRSDA